MNNELKDLIYSINTMIEKIRIEASEIENLTFIIRDKIEDSENSKIKDLLNKLLEELSNLYYEIEDKEDNIKYYTSLIV